MLGPFYFRVSQRTRQHLGGVWVALRYRQDDEVAEAAPKDDGSIAPIHSVELGGTLKTSDYA